LVRGLITYYTAITRNENLKKAKEKLKTDNKI